jgi:uncharacterized protein (DUF433 family)
MKMELLELVLPDCRERWEDGSIRVVGHRVMLYHIVDQIFERHDLEALSSQFPTISRTALQTIWSFSHDHEEEMRRFREEQRSQAEKLRLSIEHAGPFRGELLKRMDETRGQRRPDY